MEGIYIGAFVVLLFVALGLSVYRKRQDASALERRRLEIAREKGEQRGGAE